MQQTLRPYATAGIAIVGTSLIAVTPAVAPMPDTYSTRGVALTDLAESLAPWQDILNTASANITTLLNNFYIAPGVAWQQLGVNLADYAQQFLDNPSSSTLASINDQIQEHLKAVLTGYTLQDATQATMDQVTNHTMDGAGLAGHAILFSQIASFLPPTIDADAVLPIINFLGSPLSGIIMGALGPMISPWVALANSITDGDSFTQMMANMVGGFYNGATLNLDSLVPMINDSGFLSPGMYMNHLEFAFGGLLSPGSVSVGPYGISEGGSTIATIPAVGGSIFNSLGLELSGVPVLGNLDVEGQAIGPIGAWEAWGQTIGALLGSGWDGKGPVDVSAPGVGLDLPIIPTDFP